MFYKFNNQNLRNVQDILNKANSFNNNNMNKEAINLLINAIDNLLIEIDKIKK